MNNLKVTGIIGLVGAILCGTGEFLLHFDPLARFSGYEFMADISDTIDPCAVNEPISELAPHEVV
jgi:hypothetical protein